MGILGSNNNRPQRSGGILGRKKREEGERYAAQLRTFPDVFDPMQVQENIKSRFSAPEPIIPKTLLESATEEARANSINPLVRSGVLHSVVQPKSTLPTFEDTILKASMDNRSPTEKWLDDRRASRREEWESKPEGSIARNFLVNVDPLTDLIDRFQTLPVVSAFQRGSGGTFTAPETGPEWVNKSAEIIGNIAGGAANMRGAGISPIDDFLYLGRGASQTAAQRVPQLSGPVARRAVEGVVGGGAAGAVDSALRGETDLQDIATSAGLGAVTGGIGDVALGGLSDAARKVIYRYRQKTPAKPAEPTLGLPEPRQRGNANSVETPDVITPEYTFQLPRPSQGTLQRLDNVMQGRADLQVIDDEIRQLQASYDRAVVDEYNYLKQSMQDRGGVQQGQLQRDFDGNVTGRAGRISNNPLWYQEYFAANGKTPSNRELFRLARERVDNGFRDEAGDVPSWRVQNGFDENLAALQDVRSTLTQSLRELDPAINITDSPLKSTELSFNRQRPAATKTDDLPKAPESPMTPVPEDVSVPPAPDLPAADSSMGVSAFGQKKKYTNPEDTRQYIATKTEREPIDISKMADDFYTKNVDNLQRINDFDKYIEKQIGRKLNGDERAYYLALNQRGADMTARHILTERLVDSQGRVIGKSLKDISSQIPSNPTTYDNFKDYLIARHAITRMGRGETVYPKKANMTIERVEQKVADYESRYPEFTKIAAELDQWNDTLGRAWLVDTGLVPESMYSAWREANPAWIPNQRKFTELEKRQRATGARRGFGNQNNPVKKYSPTGSEREIIDPFESLIEYTDRYVKTARRNEVMQAIYRQLLKHPDELDGFATVLRREKLEPEAMGPEGMTGLLDELDDEYDKAFLKKNDLEKDNVISALVDGERVYMRVEDPEFLDALVSLKPQARNAVIEAARKVTDTMKILTTGINPIFGLTRNIFRDIPEAYIYSKTTDNPFRYAWDVLEGFISVFADGASGAVGNSRALQKVTPQSFRRFLDKQAKLYKDYKALGGGHSSPAAANRDLLAQSKRELLPQQRKGVRAITERGWAALENLNNALESGPRLGEFKRSRQAGNDTYGSRVKGIFEAQDITTNFKRHGQVVKDADAVIPYLNAAVQGLDKLLRAFKDRPPAVVAKALGAIAAPTIALYALNYNNPDYQKLNNYTKDNFYLIPTEDGKFLKIPKPRELGVPFGGLLERSMRAWFEDDPEAFRDFAETAATMFTPPGLPVVDIVKGDMAGAALRPLRDTVAGPLVEIASNENFTGAPIVPGYLENLSPEMQYDANTSEIGKYIGDLMNVSPKQVDHLIRSYTGVIGQLGLPATTQGATIEDTLTKQVTADSVFSTDASSHFYELKEKLDTMYADAKHTGVAPKGYNDEARKYLNDVASQLSDYTKAIREIDNSTTLSSEEKKEYKRQLTDQRNELARQAYEAVRDFMKGSE